MFTFDSRRVPHGFSLFVWVIGDVGGVSGCIARCKLYGLDGVFLKGADGGSIWTAQFNADVVKQFHDAGLGVIGWQYVYGGPGQGAALWSTVQGEIDAAKYILSCGADGYCFDNEVEFTGKSAQATQECQGIRAAYPNASIGYNPYPYPSSAPQQPFFEFNSGCDWCMPQLYDGQDGLGDPAQALAKCQSDFAHWSPIWAARPGGKPAIPLCIDWQAANWPGAMQPDAYIAEAAQVSKAAGIPCISYWDMDKLSPAEETAMAQASHIWHGGTPPGEPTLITIDKDAQGNITGAQDATTGQHVGAGIAKVIAANGWEAADLSVGEQYGLSEGVTVAVVRGAAKAALTYSPQNGVLVYSGDIAAVVQDLVAERATTPAPQTPTVQFGTPSAITTGSEVDIKLPFTFGK